LTDGGTERGKCQKVGSAKTGLFGARWNPNKTAAQGGKGQTLNRLGGLNSKGVVSGQGVVATRGRVEFLMASGEPPSKRHEKSGLSGRWGGESGYVYVRRGGQTGKVG